ncbi:MAG TPA: amidohydrolase family protein, partial [Terriglobales bacterium]
MRLTLLQIAVFLFSSLALAQESPVTLHADTLFDGKGNVQRNVSITVQNGKILSVDQGASGAPGYDLRGLTVMPRWIDTHVHMTWHFGPSGHFEDKNEIPAEATLAAEGNAWQTLLAGFTTVQSLGSPEDKALRESINRGVIPGPRILTALRPLTDSQLTLDQIRDYVRKVKADGADVLKIFVSKSIREGGGQTLTDEQLKAACDEAKAQGLRSVVHAYRSAVKATAVAGCTTVEHGTYATDDDLRAMAEHNTFFDPQVGLVIHNYLDNKAKFLGIGNYTEEGFGKMQEVLPLNAEMFKRALKTPGLKIVFGTDAVAGAHGRNAEEFIYRVRDGGQDPMPALVAANATAAE